MVNWGCTPDDDLRRVSQYYSINKVIIKRLFVRYTVALRRRCLQKVQVPVLNVYLNGYRNIYIFFAILYPFTMYTVTINWSSNGFFLIFYFSFLLLLLFFLTIREENEKRTTEFVCAYRADAQKKIGYFCPFVETIN